MINITQEQIGQNFRKTNISYSRRDIFNEATTFREIFHPSYFESNFDQIME